LYILVFPNILDKKKYFIDVNGYKILFKKLEKNQKIKLKLRRQYYILFLIIKEIEIRTSAFFKKMII